MESVKNSDGEALQRAPWNSTRELVATGLIIETARRRAAASAAGQVTPVSFEVRMAEMRQRLASPDRSNN